MSDSTAGVTTLFDLGGRRALVTGATQGLGLATVLALAAHGASIVLSDRSAAACTDLAQHLAASGVDALAAPADLAVPAEVDALAAAAGAIDVLVCNAGIAGPAGPLASASDADWDQVLQVNLRSAVRLTSQLLPGMAARGGGSVILMSSIAGLRGNGAIGPYGVTKAALAQLARNLAVEWGPRGVRVNAVSPGLIRTPLSTALLADPAFMERRLKATPLRRPGEPEEVAGAVVFLASRAGGFVTGHNLVVDGGTLVSDGS